MEKEVLEKLKKAGEISAKAREYGKKICKSGILALELAEKIDGKIIELGGKPAFPTCISINEMAAHYSPTLEDKTVIKEGDYVKMDLGAHIDGYIADTAVTVKVGHKSDEIIEASEKMLETALKMFKPGTTLGEIGEAIENVAKEFKMNPIRNLTGHSIDRYTLHAGKIVPNIKNDSKYQIREDEVYACEPFSTPGTGFVKDHGNPQIFRWVKDHPVRSPEGRKIMELARGEFASLPFAKRWIQKQIPTLKVDTNLKELTAVNALYSYSPLREVSGKNVAQTEHTIIVREKPIVTTY